MPVKINSKANLQIAVFLVLVMAPTSTVLGQQQQPPRNYISAPKAQTSDFDVQILRDKVELPDISVFGQKPRFLGGSVNPKGKNGPAYMMEFDAVEPPDQIVNHYASILRSSPWTLEQQSHDRVSGFHKEGHYCVITTNAPQNPKAARATYRIYFQIYERGR